MKKLTKKFVKEAANYMVMIDMMTKSNLYTEVLEAENLIDAMDEANERFTAGTYLLAILEKTGETLDGNGMLYREVMRSRTAGRWATMKAEGCTEGATWGRFFFGDEEDSWCLTCSK